MEKETKELDLFGLIKIVANWVASVFCKVIGIIKCVLIFSIKNILYIGLAMLLGVGVAYFYSHSPCKQRYRAELVLHINDGEAFVLSDLIKSLDESCVGYPDKLSKAMNITQAEAAPISRIESFYYIDVNKNNTPDYIDYEKSFIERDTISQVLKDQLCVRFEATNREAFYPMEKGLVNYLNSIPSLVQRKELRLAQMKKNIEFFDEEIKSIDSLKNIEYFKRPTDLALTIDKTVLLSNKDQKMFQDDLFSMQERRYYADIALKVKTDVVTIVSPISVLKAPKYPFNDMLKICLVISYFIGLLISYLIYRRKDIIKAIKGKEN